MTQNGHHTFHYDIGHTTYIKCWQKRNITNENELSSSKWQQQVRLTLQTIKYENAIQNVSKNHETISWKLALKHHILVIMHKNTKSPKHMRILSSIVQNDGTNVEIIKTYDRAHKSQNCRKNNIIHV